MVRAGESGLIEQFRDGFFEFLARHDSRMVELDDAVAPGDHQSGCCADAEFEEVALAD